MAQSWIKDFQKSEDYKNIIRQRKEEAEQKRESRTPYSVLREQLRPTLAAPVYLVESAYNAISGRTRTEFEDLPEIFDAGVGPDSVTGSANIIASQFYNSNPAASLDIIKSADPKAQFNKDKFNNIIVTFGNGTQGYLNKPGLTRADVNQFMGLTKIYGAIPFSAIKKYVAPVGGGKLSNAVKSVAANATVFGSVSVGQDVVASVAGSKQGIDSDKLMWNVFGGAVGAPLIGFGIDKLRGLAGFAVNKAGQVVQKVPGARKTYEDDPAKVIAPWTTNATASEFKRYIDEQGNVTQLALDEMREKDPDILEILDQDDLKIFGQSYDAGASYDNAKIFTLASKYGIDLNAAQIGRDPIELAKMQEGLKGVYGETLRQELLQFKNRQDEQLLKAAQSLFNDESLTIDKVKSDQNIMNQVGTTIQETVRDAQKAADNIVTQNYNVISGDLDLDKDSVNIFKSNLKNTLQSQYINIDSESQMSKLSSARGMINTIDEFVNEINKQEKFTNKTLKQLESFRSILSSDLSGAIGNDKRAGNIILAEFDRFYGDILDNAVSQAHTLTQEQVDALTKARESAADKFKVFGVGGKVKQNDYTTKFVRDTLLEGNKSGLQIMEEIMGFNYLKKPNEAINRIDRIYDTIKYLPNSEEVRVSVEADMKDAFLSNLLKNAIQEEEGEMVLNVKKYIKNISDYTDSDLGMKITSKVLNDEEIKSLKALSDVFKTTLPNNAYLNYSNTSSTFFRLLNEVPALGTLLKVGAYDYYGLKGLFTYRAFSTLKSTKGDTAALLNDILAPDMDADTKTALSRSVFGSLYSPKEEMMGKVERDYGVKIDRIRSKEQLDQISKRIAPNRFEKNKNIQKIINSQF